MRVQSDGTRAPWRGAWVALGVALAAGCLTGCDDIRRFLVAKLTPTYEAPAFQAEGGGAIPEAKAALPVPAVGLVKVAEGFTEPTDVQFVPGAPLLAVVLQKSGTARVVDLASNPGKLLTDLLRVEVRSESELGLLGLAFHPDFKTNGRFFINHTPKSGAMRTVISEWKTDPAAVGTVAAKPVRDLLSFSQPYQNHDGGQLQFGPDGMLYIGTGDGGFRADPKRAGQDLGTLLGKMLRIDVDQVPEGKTYGIPKDNPFVDRKGARAEIWAWGLRNPWRFSFDAAGRLWVADVGQDSFEEVDVVARGDNLGWNVMEGRHCFEAESCKNQGMVAPVFEYGREMGTSITGGYTYHGTRMAALTGRFVFADFTSGRMWALAPPKEPGAPADVLELPRQRMLISTFGRDAQGEVYVAGFGSGALFRLEPLGR